MTSGLFTGSAKIYQFPVRPRAAPGSRIDPRPALTASPSICAEAFGCWYHDEAIHDAAPPVQPVREH